MPCGDLFIYFLQLQHPVFFLFFLGELCAPLFRRRVCVVMMSAVRHIHPSYTNIKCHASAQPVLFRGSNHFVSLLSHSLSILKKKMFLPSANVLRLVSSATSQQHLQHRCNNHLLHQSLGDTTSAHRPNNSTAFASTSPSPSAPHSLLPQPPSLPP